MTILAVIVALAVGVLVGFFFFSLCDIAHRADQHIEGDQ